MLAASEYECYPKIASVGGPSFDILENVKMLEFFDEEFVERAHQKGLKYNRITKGMSQNPIKNTTIW